jgi:RNase P subunit RPR2
MSKEKIKKVNCDKCRYLIKGEHCQLKMMNPSSFNECSKIKIKIVECAWYREKI